MSYFHNAQTTYEGKTLQFSKEEGSALEDRGNYWHRPSDPSTWLAVAVFRAVQAKFPEVPQAVIFELSAQTLGITDSQLSSAIDWHENYMRWHDGDPDYKV